MPRINSTSCSVTVIFPQGMWKLLVSGCHLSTKAESKEDPVSPANCTTAGSLGSNRSGTRLVGGRDFSGLFCRDPAILLITDMKLPVNPFPLPREQARDHHRHCHHHHHHHHHVHHHPHAHSHHPHCYECRENQS
ncbi:hypothetical protein M9H77_35126 [Catharanthus roseus]|uniref:Uncharacterized protein n=1 Tax=Catharanthus roseus TaxID=4058 RepID=A0ACB9ZQP1_CATRO|nr:hypothetical protein M9H77_35126 [Catharanthus roseus]